MSSPRPHLPEPCAAYLREACTEPLTVLDETARAATEALVDRLEIAGEDRALTRVLRSAITEFSTNRTSDETLMLNGTVLAGVEGARWQALAPRLVPGGRLVLFGRSSPSIDEAVRATVGKCSSSAGLSLRIIRDSEGYASELCPRFELRSASRVPRVVLLPDPGDAPAQIRTLGPFEELDRRGQIRLTVLGNDHRSALRDADLLVLQRFGGLPAFKLLCQAKRLGIPVSLDLDDDFFSIPWFNPSADNYTRFDQRLILTALLRGADQLIVSTPALAKVMGRYNRRVIVAHNLVDTSQFVYPQTPEHSETRDSEVVTFGYIGTNTHLEDLRPVLAPLKELLESEQGRVRAVFIGGVPEDLARSPNVEFKGWFNSYRSAAAALSRSGVNVALAPLLNLEFNRSKSAMKYLEYGACGIPGLYSELGAFPEHVRHRENGFLVKAHTADAWRAALRFVVEHPEERNRWALSCYQDVCSNHSIETQADRFFEPYQSLMDSEISSNESSAPNPSHSNGRETRRTREVHATSASKLLGPTEPVLSVVLRVSRDLGTAVGEISRARESIGNDSDNQWIVVTPSRDLCQMLAMSEDIDVVYENPDRWPELWSDHGDDGLLPSGGSAQARSVATSPLHQAMDMAKGKWVLSLTGSCELTAKKMDRIRAHATNTVFAVGPTVLDPLHHQGTHRFMGEDELFSDGAQAKPRVGTPLIAATRSQSIPFLSAGVVLFRRRPAFELGLSDEIQRGGTWEDVLLALCLKAREAGMDILVANDVQVLRPNQPDASTPSYIKARCRSRRQLWERYSTILSSLLLSEPGGKHRSGTAGSADPSGGFGNDGRAADSELVTEGAVDLQACRLQLTTQAPDRLAVIVFARKQSPYLAACLRHLFESAPMSFVVHLCGDSEDSVVRGLARHWELPIVPDSDFETQGFAAAVRRFCAENPDFSHALFMHDGVMVAPSAMGEMLFTALATGASCVVPVSNDGAPSQLSPHESSESNIGELHSVERRLQHLASGRCSSIERVGIAAQFMRLASLAKMSPDDFRFARRSTYLAEGAYVRVVNHPESVTALGNWAYAKGPFDLSSQALAECGEIERLAPADSLLRQLRCLIPAHRNNRFDARILAKVGGLLAINGEPERGMTWVENALRVDPFSIEIRELDEQLRRHLGSLCLHSTASEPQKPKEGHRASPR